MIDFNTAIGVALFFGALIGGLAYVAWYIGSEIFSESVRRLRKFRRFELRSLLLIVLLFAATFGLARLPHAVHIFGNPLVAALFLFPTLAIASWLLGIAVRATVEAVSGSRPAAARERVHRFGPGRLVINSHDVSDIAAQPVGDCELNLTSKKVRKKWWLRRWPSRYRSMTPGRNHVFRTDAPRSGRQ